MKLSFFILVILLSSCRDDTSEIPPEDSYSNIQYLEQTLQEQMDSEDILRRELESAQLYIQTLEYENSVLDSLLLTKRD